MKDLTVLGKIGFCYTFVWSTFKISGSLELQLRNVKSVCKLFAFVNFNTKVENYSMFC